MANILTIDRNKMFSEALQGIVKDMGHELTCVYTVEDGLKRPARGFLMWYFSGTQMPDGNVVDVLPEIIETRSFPKVIVITNFGDPDESEAPIKAGAWDYIKWPSSAGEIKLPLVRALQYHEKKRTRRPSWSWGGSSLRILSVALITRLLVPIPLSAGAINVLLLVIMTG
jgi:two-component system NtrC family response regulator